MSIFSNQFIYLTNQISSIFFPLINFFLKFAWKNIQVKITKRIWQENNNTSTLAILYHRQINETNSETDWETCKTSI